MTKAADILLPYLFQLDRYEASEFITMSRKWGKVSKDLYTQADELARMDTVTLPQMIGFREQVSSVAAEYAAFNTVLIIKGQEHFAQQGEKSARQMLNVAKRPYRQLSQDALETRVGRTSSMQPIDSLLEAKYRDREDRIETVLTNRNSNTPALVALALTGILHLSISTARQEQMDVFRDIQTASFKESGIATMKNWVGEPDACEEICVPGIEGSPYPMDAMMDTHKNCRCAWEPVLAESL